MAYGADVIAEYDGAGSLLRRYVHGPGADEPLVWLEGAGTSDRRWLLSDARGSVVALASAAGAVTTVNKYSDYGAPASGNAGRFQYTGQMWLGELGLYHYKARAYSPALGRFLQTDPIGYAGGVNLYAYVGNDPVNFTDPSGLTKSGCAPGDERCESEGATGGPSWGCALNPTCNYYPWPRSASSGGQGGGREHGSIVGNICVDKVCTWQYGFIPGESSAEEFGDLIVVTGRRSVFYEMTPSGQFRAWYMYGGGQAATASAFTLVGGATSGRDPGTAAPRISMGREARLRVRSVDAATYAFNAEREAKILFMCNVSVVTASAGALIVSNRKTPARVRLPAAVGAIGSTLVAAISCPLVGINPF